ncbi:MULTISPECIES: hypothetical protein [unclassified Clostridium]|uniref:hypothetical protein n=1 Tax=unclassified Clostridium TaxID=2614128 RepID=UPI0025BB73AB|nr:hypothetical protein [Clostridium sp.]MDY2630508.1 hypothetical protein [Clostridium sp.]MDY6227948.1 hypothetical protein [Clostridium sp.]
MELVVQIFQIVFYGMGTIFMIIFAIIGIWSFIIFNKYYKAKRIENYILEKIYQAINQLSYKNNSTLNDNSNEDLVDINNLLNKED